MSRYVRRNIPITTVLPWLHELIDRCGSPEAAGQFAGIGVTTMYRMLRRYNESVRRDTAARIVAALHVKRGEDRRNGGTHPRLTAARRRAAKIEEQYE